MINISFDSNLSHYNLRQVNLYINNNINICKYYINIIYKYNYTKVRNQDAGADFLKEELVKRISEKEQEFDFRVQVRKIDEVSVKEIEDATVGPDYNRGFVSIGKLIID